MDMNLANRLTELRKQHNLNQEELADKLGVSRQAVSKWECGESSPDTDNLIALAKIYGISLDELVGNTPAKNKEEGQIPPVVASILEEGNKPDEDDDDDEDGEPESRMSFAQKMIGSVGFLIVLIAYLVVGFTWKGPTGALGWASMWVLFFVPVILMGLLSAIEDRKPSHFPFALFIIGVYVATGIITGAYGFTQWWHPFWALFILIPVYHAIAGIVEHHTSKEE